MPLVLPASPQVLMPGSKESGTLALPAQLKITRYCHGEWRLSLYPTSAGRRKRIPLVGRAIESLSISDKATCVLRHRPAPPPAKVTQQLAIAYPRPLDYRSEVQGISKKCQKTIRLPSRKLFRQAGRIRIQECGSIAERQFGNNALFFTGTIPGSGWRTAAVIAAYSGKIVNRVKQWFRDNLTDIYSFFSVWEWQSRGMLHLHLCVASNETKKLESLRSSFKSRWINLLHDISWESNRDLFRKNASWTWLDDLSTVQAEAVWVTKSITRYLSKYSCKATLGREKPKYFCPTRWWSVDRRTQRLADKERTEVLLRGFTGSVGMAVLESLAAVFRAKDSAMATFRNFCWNAYGGINLFQKTDLLMPQIMQMVGDNYSEFLSKGRTINENSI